MAKRKKDRAGVPIGSVPPPPPKSAPDAPSAEKLAAKAKEIKAKPRKAAPGKTETPDELDIQIKTADHFRVAEEMALDTVDMLDIGMANLDDAYEREIAWVKAKKRIDVTYRFNQAEKDTTAKAALEFYKRFPVEVLQRWGTWFTGIALVATVLYPRWKLSMDLGKVAEHLDGIDEEIEKRSKEAAFRPAETPQAAKEPPVSGISVATAGGQTNVRSPGE